MGYDRRLVPPVPEGQTALMLDAPPAKTRKAKEVVKLGLPDAVSLGQARSLVAEHLDEGVECPACFRLARRYSNRQINSQMAVTMIRLYRARGGEYGRLQLYRDQTGRQNREESKARYWGLLEEATERQSDGKRSGWWRLTPKGIRYVLGQESVPQFAEVFDKELIQLHGPSVTIRHALGKAFDYDELMSGVPAAPRPL